MYICMYIYVCVHVSKTTVMWCYDAIIQLEHMNLCFSICFLAGLRFQPHGFDFFGINLICIA